MQYAWELRVFGGGRGLWYFRSRPTALECQQRLAAVCGDRYRLRRVACPDGVCYDPIGR